MGLHVIWKPTPTTFQADTGGIIGGVFTVHLSFPIPENDATRILKEFKIHEDAGHHSDIVLSDLFLDGTWSSVCGDPDPNQRHNSGMAYYDQRRLAPIWHNGSYTITAKVEYSLYDPYTGAIASKHNALYQINVDVRDLLVDSTEVNTNSNPNFTGAPGPVNNHTDNPTPILWDPQSMASVALTAQIKAAYSAQATVTLNIYSSAQTLVKTLTQKATIGGLNNNPGPPATSSVVTTPVQFTWDGTKDYDSSGMQA